MKKTVFIILCVMICFCFCLTSFAEGEETAIETSAEDNAATEIISNDFIDKYLALAEELRMLKESDYTFKERILQLINSENLAATLGTLMTVISSIAIFVFRSFQKKDSIGNTIKINALSKTIEEEREENKVLREDVNVLINVIRENNLLLSKINTDTTENHEMVEIAKRATTATAKMVSDAFQHSRTIDSTTKELLTHDYLEVLKAEEKTSAGEG